MKVTLPESFKSWEDWLIHLETLMPAPYGEPMTMVSSDYFPNVIKTIKAVKEEIRRN